MSSEAVDLFDETEDFCFTGEGSAEVRTLSNSVVAAAVAFTAFAAAEPALTPVRASPSLLHRTMRSTRSSAP